MTIEQSDRDAAGNAELKRIMNVMLPDLHTIFNRVRDNIKEAKEASDLPLTELAADYRNWYDKSVEELTRHYNKYELPLTVAEREKEQRENPNAAVNSGHKLTGLNVREAMTEYVEAQKYNPLQELQFRRAIDRIQTAAAQLNMTNVASLENRKRDGAIKSS